MRGKYLAISLAVFTFSACLDREYRNPFLADDNPTFKQGWEQDRDGNGISDSVEFYARDCSGTPTQCLHLALDAAATRSQAGLVNTKGDTAGTVKPKDTVVVKPADTLIVVKPVDTVIVVKPVDTVIVVLPDTNVYEEQVSVSPMEFTVGDPAQAPVIVWKPANTSNQGYTLLSGDSGVVQVVAGGGPERCRPVAPGQATVTLKTRAKGLVAAFTVTVKAAPLLAIKVAALSAEDLELKEGSKARPLVTFLPPNADNKAYTLASSNENVVSVNGAEITAVKKGGADITVTAADGAKTTKFKVKVTEAGGKDDDD